MVSKLLILKAPIDPSVNGIDRCWRLPEFIAGRSKVFMDHQKSQLTLNRNFPAGAFWKVDLIIQLQKGREDKLKCRAYIDPNMVACALSSDGGNNKGGGADAFFNQDGEEDEDYEEEDEYFTLISFSNV